MNPIPFPNARIRPTESPTEHALQELTNSYADMHHAIANATTVAEAYRLYRHLAVIEHHVMTLTTAAMKRCEVLELEAEVGL